MLLGFVANTRTAAYGAYSDVCDVYIGLDSVVVTKDSLKIQVSVFNQTNGHGDFVATKSWSVYDTRVTEPKRKKMLDLIIKILIIVLIVAVLISITKRNILNK